MTFAIDQYRTLGATGLRVSPVALGTMTFGGGDGWRSDDDTARAVFRRYLDAGGNFVDTADVYAGGRGEELLGTFMHEAGVRERLVVATKFGVTTDPDDPNARGNGRKHMLAALERSLRRLRTDYVDVFWLHLWDTVTPVEEVMAAFDAVVRAGKARAVGLSNVPAWYTAKAQLLARGHGWAPVAAVQLEYSLLRREIEWEHVPCARDLGIGVVPWSPLGGGFLTGKYERATAGGTSRAHAGPTGTYERAGTGPTDPGRQDTEPTGPGRQDTAPMGSGRQGTGLTGPGRLDAGGTYPDRRPRPDRHWAVLDEVRAVAGELGRTPAQVALAWLAARPAVASVLVGATSVSQLDANLAATTFSLPPSQTTRLNQASTPEPPTPYELFHHPRLTSRR